MLKHKVDKCECTKCKNTPPKIGKKSKRYPASDVVYTPQEMYKSGDMWYVVVLSSEGGERVFSAWMWKGMKDA